MELNYYRDFSKRVFNRILKMMYESQTAHLGSCLSCLDIMTVLYNGILWPNKHYVFPYPDWKTIMRELNLTEEEAKKKWETTKRPMLDRFILSKGHAAATWYAVLAERGYFPPEILDTYGKDGGLHGHPERGCVPGVEVSTGSLGHGLPIGCGMAKALKLKDELFRVFVLLSDGECDEGSVWESALFASHHKLDNLIAIIDYNKWQAFGKTNEVLNLEPLKEKWEAFGWSVREIDGHDFQQIWNAVESVPYVIGKPNLVIAHTLKGKGLPMIEDKLESHYQNINRETYEANLHKDLN